MSETAKADKEKPANQAGAAEKANSAADKIGDKASKPVSGDKKHLKGLSLFAAGLAGGIIALMGGAALLAGGYMQSGNPPVRTVTAASIAAEKKAMTERFEALLAEREKAWDAQTAQMQDKIEELRQKADAALSAPAAPDVGLSDRLADIAKKLDAQADSVNTNKSAIAALKDSLLGVEQRRAALEAKIQALRDDMRRLAEKRDNAQKNVTRLLALQEFQVAIDSGAPYAAQLAVFNAAFPAIWDNIQNSGDTDIASLLARYGQTGLPRDSALAQDFTQLADRLASGKTDGSGSGLWRKTRRALSPWISARPQGQIEGSSPQAALARMEFALERGDEAAALLEIANLPPDIRGKAADYLAPLYLKQAAHEAVRQALLRLFPLENTAAPSAPAVSATPAEKVDAVKTESSAQAADKANVTESVPPAPAAPAPSSAPVPAP